jgi:hypothetical protein
VAYCRSPTASVILSSAWLSPAVEAKMDTKTDADQKCSRLYMCVCVCVSHCVCVCVCDTMCVCKHAVTYSGFYCILNLHDDCVVECWCPLIVVRHLLYIPGQANAAWWLRRTQSPGILQAAASCSLMVCRSLLQGAARNPPLCRTATVVQGAQSNIVQYSSVGVK